MGLFGRKEPRSVNLKELLTPEEVHLLGGELIKASHKLPTEIGDTYFRLAESIMKGEDNNSAMILKLSTAAFRYNKLNREAAEGSPELLKKLKEVLK